MIAKKKFKTVELFVMEVDRMLENCFLFFNLPCQQREVIFDLTRVVCSLVMYCSEWHQLSKNLEFNSSLATAPSNLVVNTA